MVDQINRVGGPIYDAVPSNYDRGPPATRAIQHSIFAGGLSMFSLYARSCSEAGRAAPAMGFTACLLLLPLLAGPGALGQEGRGQELRYPGLDAQQASAMTESTFAAVASAEDASSHISESTDEWAAGDCDCSCDCRCDWPQ